MDATMEPRNATAAVTRGRWRRRARTAVVFVHRWVALITGLLIMIITLSGTVILFKPELDHLLYPQLFRASPGNVALGTVVSNVKAAYPDSAITWIGTPKVGNGVYEVWLAGEPEMVVRADPGTGAVLGMNHYGDTVTDWLFQLHYTLFINKLFPGLESVVADPGGWVVGLLGIMLLLMIVSGVVVWWPSLKKLALGFTVRWTRGWYIRNYDLHKVVGMVTMPILLLPVLTGIGYMFPEGAQNVWYRATLTAKPEEAPETLQSLPPSADAKPLAWDAIAALVAQRIPAGTVTWIQAPASITSTLEVYIHTADDPDKSALAGGTHALYLDQYTGAVLWEHDALALPWAGRVWNAWMWPLHIGTWAGTWSRVLYIFIGLAPTLLAITGVYTWVTRTRARRRQRAGKARAGAAAPQQQPTLANAASTNAADDQPLAT